MRAAQIVLYAYGSADANMRHSVFTLARSSGLACTPLLVAANFDGTTQGALWVVALLVDFGVYFDVVALVAERKLTETQGVERSKMARDSYSYLHLP